jgi:hypothetical protein
MDLKPQTTQTMRILADSGAVRRVVMRVLNFDAPELHWRHGSLMVWVILVAVFIGVPRWFSARGWLR